MMDSQLSLQIYLVAPSLASWGFARLIGSAKPRLDLVGMSETLGEARSVIERQMPDAVVVDSDGGCTADELRDFCNEVPVKVVAITSRLDHAPLDSAIACGLRGVVSTHDAPAILLRAIEHVCKGEMWLDREATGRMLMHLAQDRSPKQSDDAPRERIATLTQRERQAIVAFAKDTGAPAKVIAGRLFISEHTLRNHLTSIYGKLGLVNRVDLYAFAVRHQLDRS